MSLAIIFRIPVHFDPIVVGQKIEGDLGSGIMCTPE